MISAPGSRRQFFAQFAGAAAAGWLAGGLPGLATEAVTISWPSRVVQLPADDENQQPPVVTAVCLHSNGQWLATAGDDHIVRVWSLADGKLLQRLDQHLDWVRTIDYSPDGKLLASAGNDRQILLWDAATGEMRDVLAAHAGAIAAIRFSHDGSRLAALGFEGTIKIYDVRNRVLVAEPSAPCRDMRAIAFSPDDRLLAAGGRCGAIRLIATERAEILRDISAHRQRVRTISFSPDGSYLASAGEDRLIHILPLADGAAGFTLPARPSKVLALEFYGPHQLAAAGSDNLIRLWDVIEQREIGLLAGHTGTIAALECQGKVLISAGYDTTVRIWSIADHVAGTKGPLPRVGRQPAIEGLPRQR
ncbi:MAG: WD40 repeat domain-containing protein [Pirellulaceae bacterium]